MHPRNVFAAKPPDFVALAAAHPKFGRFLRGRKVDFGDPEATRQLTIATLQFYFQLEVDIPDGHLVPTVPQKLNYLHWVEDLLSSVGQDRSGSVRGVDIGTGPCCIYALLGCRLHDSWEFVTTDVSRDAVESGRENLRRNGLDGRVTVLHNPDADKVLCDVVDFSRPYDFCMCNPPFFPADRPHALNRTGRRPGAPTHSTAQPGERETGGGEVAFVRRIVADSATLRDRVRWFTTMLGCKSSLQPVLEAVRSVQPTFVTESRLVQGKSHRWVVAWTFGDAPAALGQAAGANSGRKRKRRPADRTIVFPTAAGSGEQALATVKDLLLALGGITCTQPLPCQVVAVVRNVTWGNRRRRRRLEEQRRRRRQDAESVAVGAAPCAALPPEALAARTPAPQQPEEAVGEAEGEAEEAGSGLHPGPPLVTVRFVAGGAEGAPCVRVEHVAGELELTHRLFLYMKAELTPGARGTMPVGSGPLAPPSSADPPAPE